MLRRVGWLNINSRETIDVYSCGLNNGMLYMNPFCNPRGTHTRIVKVSTNVFPLKRAMPRNLIEAYKIAGMVKNVVIQGDACNMK